MGRIVPLRLQTRDALSVTRSSITGQSAQKHFEHLHANRKDLRSAPPPASQPARPYRGYYYDTETGLYYLQSRYYDPEVGRFINADAFASTGQGILGTNMFAYCRNNPVVEKDSYGGIPKCCYLLQDDIGWAGNEDGIRDITEELDALMRKHAKELKKSFSDAVIGADKGYRYLGGRSQQTVTLIAFFITLDFFIEKVKTGGDWDLKNNIYPSSNQYIYNGKEYTGEDIGNIHFGYVGAALYNSWFLHFGAGVYQIFSGSKWEYWSTCFDEHRDREMIEYGIKLYTGRL